MNDKFELTVEIIGNFMRITNNSDRNVSVLRKSTQPKGNLELEAFVLKGHFTLTDDTPLLENLYFRFDKE